MARALGSIEHDIFCYNAIASSSIVHFLPGFVALKGVLEINQKDMQNGSSKLIYAIVWALMLGVGLQAGSDLWLVGRHHTHGLSGMLFPVTEKLGTLVIQTATRGLPTGAGSWKYRPGEQSQPGVDWVQGCVRTAELPWYSQPAPWFGKAFLVPAFSLVSSLANGQPLWNIDMLVMVSFACVSFTLNIVADHFIFDRTDVVSCIGAFVSGILGNVYDRKFGGTAYTSMITGILFLVPSGFAVSGGITAEPNVIDMCYAMVTVVIGIAVGLLSAQFAVYWFGNRRKGINFSF
jgi:uncharacterized membrane protein YjjB (DUF3815 family)